MPGLSNIFKCIYLSKPSSAAQTGGYVRLSGITLRCVFKTHQITHSCYAPALPSPQLCETPAGKGSPSTWTGPSLPPESARWRPDIWLGLSDCRRERWDEHQPIRRKYIRKHLNTNLTLLQNLRQFRKIAVTNKQLQIIEKKINLKNIYAQVSKKCESDKVTKKYSSQRALKKNKLCSGKIQINFQDILLKQSHFNIEKKHQVPFQFFM